MKTKLIPILALTGLALSALPATAQITIVNNDNTTFTNVVPDTGTPGINNLEANPWTVSFDAGATANKLIVTLSSETGTTGGPPSITYNGVALTRVPGTVNQRSFGIWYLDNPYTGGVADLVINMTSYSTVNGIGFGVVSVSGAAPGSSGGNSSSGTAVTLTTRAADSLIVSTYASNAVAIPTVPSGYSQLYASNDIGSAQGAAAYLNSVAAGPQTVTYAQTGTLSGHSTAAAAFVQASAFPVLTSVSPADNAINVAIGANLVANFSEPVVAGTGNVELWQVGGSLPVESFDVASSLSGQTLTINPTANLTPGGEYYVLIPATALVDTSGGNPFAGISDPTAWNFTADGTAPTLVSVNPVDDAPAVRISSNLVATFSEPVVAGTGNVELWQDGGGSPLESFDVASQVTFSGATLTINPTADLMPGIGYHIRIASTAIVDASNFAFAGISDPALWNFTADGTPPTLATLSPVDDAGLVSLASNLVATFSESVAAGTGSIELWKVGGGSPVESFDVASQLTISGATLTINPTANLDYSAAYYVIIPATAVKDLSGNLFSGVTTSTAWDFTTGTPPPALTVLTSLTTGNFVATTTRTAPTTYTLPTDFDPDDTADALVLMLATEGVSPSATVFFGSQQMTQAVYSGTNNPVGVYYLNNPLTSPQSVTVNITVGASSGTNINGMGFTIFALNNSVNGGITPTAVVTNSSTQTPLSIDINVPDTGSFVVAGSNNGADTTLGLTSPLTGLYGSDFGSLRGVFGYQADVAAGTNTYTFTGATSTSAAVAFVGVAAPTNTFSSWISNPAFGLAVADQDLGDDPDGDGNDNGVENFFGTNPGTFSQGLLVGIKSGNTFTFTHPQSATPASDLTASYTWSKDLASFLGNGATDGALTKVDFTTQADTPSPGITTVTATVTGTATSNLFVRVNVTQ